ncbi:hypothetical protein CASFOL_029568 [Castilleja foliolosa]|uniref:Uncharacterized protein n=1 Tax=Castilleja foliolosa TaxID=1961234 RepID=A0ABD3C9N2_9LAMI
MDSNETVSLAPSESESLSKNIVHVNGYDNAGGVSDDEGYPSGQEEFETASEDSATVETVGEDNFDEQFVDAPSDVGIFSDSEAVDVSEDDDVEIFSNNDVEGIEYALEKGEAVVADKLELGLDEIGDVDSGKLVVDEVEMNGGDESELEGEPVVDVSSSRAAVVEKIDEDGDKGATSVAEPGRVVVDEAEINGGDELEFKGDSVDELSSSGAAVVEKIDEKGDINSRKDAKEVVEPEKLVVNETEMNGVDEPESEGESVVDVCGSGAAVVGKTDENKDINDGKVAKEVVEPGKSVVDEAGMNGGDEPESDGDYVVDVSGSGAAVVEKIDENRDINNRKDAKEVVEPGKSVVGEAEMNGGDEPESEGDSGAVVSGSGAAVVEKIDQNRDFSNGKDAKEVVEPEKSEVINRGVDSEEDCAVDDGNGDGKIERNGDVANESDAKEVIEAGENATEDNKTTTKSVTNGEIGVDRDENQLHPSNGVFEDELVSEELDHADFNETKVENDVDKDFEFIEEFAQTTGMDL